MTGDCVIVAREAVRCLMKRNHACLRAPGLDKYSAENPR